MDRVNVIVGLEIVVAISLWIVIGLNEREATEEDGESNMITFDIEFVIDATYVVGEVNREDVAESRSEASVDETEVVPEEDVTLVEPFPNTTSIDDDIVAATEMDHGQGKVCGFRVHYPFISSSAEWGNVGEDSTADDTLDFTIESMEVTESVSEHALDVVNTDVDTQMDIDIEHNTDTIEDANTVNSGERPRQYRRVQERITLPSTLWICPVMTGGECQHCLRVAQRRAQRGQTHLLHYVQNQIS